MSIDRAVYLTCAFVAAVLTHSVLAQVVTPTWALWSAVALIAAGGVLTAALARAGARRTPPRHGGHR